MPLPEWFLMGLKDTRDDYGVVFLDGEMNGIGEGVYCLDPDIIVLDGRSGRQPADFFEIAVQGIGKLKAQAVRAAIVIVEGVVDIQDSSGR